MNSFIPYLFFLLAIMEDEGSSPPKKMKASVKSNIDVYDFINSTAAEREKVWHN